MTTTTDTSSPFKSGVRRDATRPEGNRPALGSTPQLNHLTPQPLLDPIRLVKRESIHWKRKVFHVIGIGAAGFTYALAPVAKVEALAILGVIAAIFVTLDALRFWMPSLNKKVKRDFGPFMRDYELDGLSGSSWFFFAGLIAIAAFPKMAAALGMVYLAVGDPLASFVGVRWGRIKLPGGKSLEGSLALWALCSLVGSLLLVFTAGMAAAPAIGIAAATGLTAAVAEWLPINKKLDDNFVMPLLTGAVATLLLTLA